MFRTMTKDKHIHKQKQTKQQPTIFTPKYTHTHESNLIHFSTTDHGKHSHSIAIFLFIVSNASFETWPMAMGQNVMDAKKYLETPEKGMDSSYAQIAWSGNDEKKRTNEQQNKSHPDWNKILQSSHTHILELRAVISRAFISLFLSLSLRERSCVSVVLILSFFLWLFFCRVLQH